jgi:hypothetical protein
MEGTKKRQKRADPSVEGTPNAKTLKSAPKSAPKSLSRPSRIPKLAKSSVRLPEFLSSIGLEKGPYSELRVRAKKIYKAYELHAKLDNDGLPLGGITALESYKTRKKKEPFRSAITQVWA